MIRRLEWQAAPFKLIWRFCCACQIAARTGWVAAACRYGDALVVADEQWIVAPAVALEKHFVAVAQFDKAIACRDCVSRNRERPDVELVIGRIDVFDRVSGQ